MKPLKGCDEGLEENLKTFLNLDYPSYEILFSVASVDDPAYLLTKQLMEQNPQVATKIIFDPMSLGPNPKVNNMMRAYELASNDLVLVSDSNVWVNRNYLKMLSRHMRNKKVGMVTSVIAGTHEKGIGGKLESVFLNTFYARWMKFLFFVGRPCVVGKSMLFRKSTARRFGGMGVLARYLAEDYMAGEAVRRLGLQVVLASEPINQYVGKLKLRGFWQRHIRWGRIRKSQAFLAFLIDPVFGSVFCSLVGTKLFFALFQTNPFTFFFIQMVLWFFLEIPNLIKSQTPISFALFGIWFLRELLALPLWINIALGNTVYWRGRKFQLEVGGLLIDEKTEVENGVESQSIPLGA